MTATVKQSVAGAPTSAQFQVVSALTGATSVRLKVGTDAALTQNVQFAAAQAPDSLGYVRHTAAGLTAATQYFYRLADNPGGGETLIGPVGMCRTLPPSGSPQSFRVALVSCVTQNAADPSAMNDWVAWAPDLAIFTGDQNYSGTVSTSTSTQVGVYETQIAGSGSGDGTAAAAGYGSSYAMMHGRAWGYYCRSDHEAGADNGDSNNAWTATNIAAAQQVFPFGTLGDTAATPRGLYQAWTVGRVRFIMIDVRNLDRSPGANTDNSSKTMLGATQLAWLQNQLLQPEPLKIIIGDVQWQGDPTTFLLTNGPDKWWSYTTERSAILAFIAANAARVGSLMFWHGDCHALASSTAVQNTWGGFPVYCAAPMHNTGGGLDLGSFGQSWNNTGGSVRGYGRITITDDGHTITSQFAGWDAVGQVARITQTDTFTCPLAARSPAGLMASFP